jgi:hypothetical protein
MHFGHIGPRGEQDMAPLNRGFLQSSLAYQCLVAKDYILEGVVVINDALAKDRSVFRDRGHQRRRDWVVAVKLQEQLTQRNFVRSVEGQHCVWTGLDHAYSSWGGNIVQSVIAARTTTSMGKGGGFVLARDRQRHAHGQPLNAEKRGA